MTFLEVRDLQFLYNDDRALLVGHSMGPFPEKGEWMDLVHEGKVVARLHFDGIVFQHGDRVFVSAREAIPLEREQASGERVHLRRLSEEQKAAADYVEASDGAWIIHERPEGVRPIRVTPSGMEEIAPGIDADALLEHVRLGGARTINQIRRV